MREDYDVGTQTHHPASAQIKSRPYEDGLLIWRYCWLIVADLSPHGASTHRRLERSSAGATLIVGFDVEAAVGRVAFDFDFAVWRFNFQYVFFGVAAKTQQGRPRQMCDAKRRYVHHAKDLFHRLSSEMVQWVMSDGCSAAALRFDQGTRARLPH